MTSTFAAHPAARHDYDHDYLPETSTTSLSADQRHTSTTSVDAGGHLSPFLSHIDSDFVSPSANQPENTPAASSTTFSHYQPSDLSDLDDDPFFGADFNQLGGPSFLDEVSGFEPTTFPSQDRPAAPPFIVEALRNAPAYPLTPEHTASVHTASPASDPRTHGAQPVPSRLPDSISPQELQKPFKSNPAPVDSFQLTPSHTNSCRSSEDGLPSAAAAAAAAAMQSPRVTVSVWDKDNGGAVRTVERSFENGQGTPRGGMHFAGDLISSGFHENSDDARRDSLGQWKRNATTGHAGLDPDHRPTEEILSVKETAARRQIEERNLDVNRWLSEKLQGLSMPQEDDIEAAEQPPADNDNVPLGDGTENRYLPGQTYYAGPGGQMSQEDYEIIAADQHWGDAPRVPQIRSANSTRHQPQSSQAAIEKFEQMFRDTDSIISRAATWGTRRRSFHSVLDLEGEVTTSGNFLKKLSLSRGNGVERSGSFLRGLVRRPSASQLLKRSRSRSRSRSPQREASRQEEVAVPGKRDSTSRLVPPSRTSSWGKNKTPSINTALASMGGGIASIGATHARKGSISGTPPALGGSPKIPFDGLTVKNPLRRPRSKSELPRSPGLDTKLESHPNIVGMLKKTGGPPVAALARPQAEPEDDDDDDDDLDDDNDMVGDANIIDNVTANFAGFREHVLQLNPALATTNSYLADRVAHQQIIRYKQLLNLKVKHLGLGANCPCGSLCLALGGSANVLDQKGDARGMDPLSTQYADDDDDEATPTEGAINQENFPQDIPMPPTQSLPAEFECQLCFSRKKFQKPSDWTKHVHEDVQPFTCTWDKCREPKIFKRKADWVRHENEGHRHLEWWTCDVDECRHVCYRRDNFLQHLVREHKFQEPKVKTKAAMKKSGGADPTWQKVEQCHQETTKRPQDEPCRFCGKIFPTWKKLTVHLAKHMEQVSLPVLRLVAVKAKELAADTIISPVQDPPPRHSLPSQNSPSNTIAQFTSPTQQQMFMSHQPFGFQDQSQIMYSQMMAAGRYQPQPQFVTPQYNNVGQVLQQQQPPLVGPMDQVYNQAQRVTAHQAQPVATHQGQPATTHPFAQGTNAYSEVQDPRLEPFPQFNALGLQTMGGMPMGGQLGYEAMVVHPSSGHQSPFSGQGSASPPYSHSPNQNANGQHRGWDDRQVPGFY